MDAAMRTLVRTRAADRCEYCGSRQSDEPHATFQFEHIIPRQHGGGTDENNLAIACPNCNLHKGPNLTGFDPFDGSLTRLFHPRLQTWEVHFALRGPLIFGISAVGRTTVVVLAMNDRLRVELRATLARIAASEPD